MRLETFLKLIAAYLCGIAGFLWGDLDGLRDKRLSSAVGFWGILRKGVMLAIVALANVLDTLVLGSDASTFRSAVIGFYLMNEGLSILENADRLGVRWPKLLRDALMQLHHEDDSPENDTLNKEDEYHDE